MKKSVTPAGLPRAGANSKPHHYKQKVQKMEGLPKMTFTEKPFDDFRQNKIHFLAWTKQPRETHCP